MYGTYAHTMDKKGRLFIPAKLREKMGDKLIVCKGLDGNCCLSVYSEEEWNKLTDKIKALPKSRARKLELFLYPSASDLECDATGRVIIPQILREYAGLEKNVSIIGLSDHAEIWDEGRFSGEQEATTPESIAKLMEEIDF